MHDMPAGDSRLRPRVQCPYGELFIYYFQGCLKDAPTAMDALIGNWEEDGCSFLFFSRPCPEQVEKILAAQPQLSLLDTFQIPYEQWQGDTCRPFRCGRFLITPPWEAPPPAGAPDATVIPIVLDPGLVFGSGTHPTTRDCLAALDLACAAGGPETALDLGTGTGLLAIAAARLGCRRTLAVDINFLAVSTARRNIAYNGLNERVLAVRGRAEQFMEPPADLLLANLHMDVLDTLIAAPAFGRQKKFILSGLLRSQAKQVQTRLLQDGHRILQTWSKEGTWFTFYGQTGGTA